MSLLGGLPGLEGTSTQASRGLSESWGCAMPGDRGEVRAHLSRTRSDVPFPRHSHECGKATAQ